MSTEFCWEEAGDDVQLAGSFNDWGDKYKMEKKYVCLMFI